MEETIKIVENSSSSFPQNPTSRIICHVCQHQFAQYTCPRCNARYCSVHCYNCHGRRCVDSFMRDNAIGEMKQIRSDEISRQKMMNILTRCHSEEEFEIMDNHESTISEELTEKVLSGEEIRIEELSPEDKKLFQRAISSGELGRMMKPWKPWWLNPNSQDISLSSDGTRLIKPLNETKPEQAVDDDGLSYLPPGPDSPLRPTRELTSVKPSPLLGVHLVDIMYGYCFTLRLYNGDWRGDPGGSWATVVGISSVLGERGKPETVKEAVFRCLERTCCSEWRDAGGVGFGVSVVEDVGRVVGMGRAAVVCSLCELEKMVSSFRGEGRRRRMKKDEERKLYFLMCWVWEQTCETLNSLASAVGKEKDSVVGYYSSNYGNTSVTTSPVVEAGRRQSLIQQVL